IALGMTMAMTSCSEKSNPIPEIPPSDGTEMTLNGGEGGSAAENTVFVDFSAGKQSSVNRKSWNLGFYNGDQFRVVLNNTAGASAIEVNKTDINAVSEVDISVQDLVIPLGTAGAFHNVDDLTGDLSKTLIPEITTNENESKVYVINS